MSFDCVYSLDAVTLVLLCALTALFLVYFRNGSKSHVELNFPPGPTPLPIIGNLHLLDLKKPHLSLMKLSEKYGPIFSIKLGTMRAVVLTGYETVKDALINNPDKFGGRPHIPIFDDLTHGYGIIFGNGESWRQMRRFTMSTLRDFGMGKKTIEDKITEEAHFLIKMFESHKGQEFNPTIQLNAAVANIICSIVFGDRFDYEDKTFIALVKRVNENFQLAGSPVVQLYNAFPILGFLPGSHKKMLKNRNLNCGFVKNFVTKNYQTLDANDPRSFIDAFTLKQQQESGSPNTYFHENNLIITVTNLFNAGMETTSTTLRWAMLLMMKYPQIQEKVHDEITTVIGSERFPGTGDRKNLPYTDAVIHEIQRFSNIVPMNLMHSTTEDVNFKGYFLPKGTPVIPLLTSVLYDKTQWETPNDFNPSNFLDADGKFVKRDAFAPFSMGRRACAGETLARMELFLFFTILIQRFRFQVPPNVSNLELTSGVAFTSVPSYQNVCAVRSLKETVSPTEPEMSFDCVYSLDAVTLVLLCALTALFLVYFRNGSKSHGELNFPPGPTPLPIIGNLHLLDLKKPHLSLMKLSEKYGPIFSIKLGTMRVVVLTGYETVKDALINNPDKFGGRPHIPIVDDLTHGYGIVFGNGESWRQMRRFTMSTLRDFGMGKKTIEDKITEEAHFLIKMFESHKGQEFNPTIQLNAVVANIICSIVFGDRFDYEDKTFIALVKRVNEDFQLAGSPVVQLYNAFPILGFLPGSHKKMLKNRNLTRGFVKNFVTKNYQTLDANDPRSFIDAFTLKQQQESGNPNTYFHENNLITTVINLFNAGMETTSTTLRWAMLLMMKYPQIQEKVHNEITTVIGSERFPGTGDRKNLPYTDAVIHEIQRFSNIVPMNLMHSTTEDVNFKGYFLPKGTPVIPLLTSVLYDKTQWETPNDFNPSNFLDADGKFVKRDAFTPFSMGRRACAGETLARMELFLFFTILIQRFRFQVPPNVTNLELVSGVAFTSVPSYQNVCAVRR
ncbi:uncharacterized protein [Hemitrygon akajei]|uniref:uncharacterized protein n=1 Tax=Hemitrygon akajei TaxID=2704970 RepID=UPI003BF9705C